MSLKKRELFVLIGVPILGISAIGMHVFTTILAYEAKGIIAAAVTLCIPGLSDLFWFASVWGAAKTPFNNFDLGWIGVMVLYGCLHLASGKGSQSQSSFGPGGS